MSKTRKIMIVAGEASGDGHAAKLVNAMRDIAGETRLEFFGAAGPAMRDAGVEAVVESDGLSIVGLPEIGRALPMFMRTFRDLKDAAIRRRPDVVILIDFPDFNLKLAKSLKNKGFKIVYYISPQIWAWRQYRISAIRKYIDLLITILPFEKDWYDARGVSHVEYVGSPLAREVYPTLSKLEYCSAHSIDPSKPIISLLPGSRGKEIERILPVLLASASTIAADMPDVQFMIAIASNRHRKQVELAIGRAAKCVAVMPSVLKIVENATYDALYASDAAAVTSGTATLETGLIGTPMAIVYKSSAINYALLKPLISVEHFGLINLIADERIVKELIQGDFTAETLTEELLRLLNPEENARIRKKLNEAADKLGHGGASKRAAEAILKLIG